MEDTDIYGWRLVHGTVQDKRSSSWQRVGPIELTLVNKVMDAMHWSGKAIPENAMSVIEVRKDANPASATYEVFCSQYPETIARVLQFKRIKTVVSDTCVPEHRDKDPYLVGPVRMIYRRKPVPEVFTAEVC